MTTSRQILEDRARLLAKRVVDHDAHSDDDVEALVIRVGDERIAIPLGQISAISRATAVSPFPRATAPELGVAAWRGRALTVLTLEASEPKITETSRFVVIGDARRADVAILVDAVDDTTTIARSTCVPLGTSRFGDAATGMTPDATLLLDARKLVRTATTMASTSDRPGTS